MQCSPEEEVVWPPEDCLCIVHTPNCMVAEEPRLSKNLPLWWSNPGMLSELASIVLPLLLELSCPHTWGESPNNPVAL
jgi:hypothetical protein